jgi:hypothetical protein
VVPGSAFFQYGITTGYGLSTPAQPVPAQVDPLVLAALSGLAPSTVYHYRLVVQNPDATTYGSDATFQTASLPPGGNTGLQPGSQTGPGSSGPPCLDTRKFRFHLHGLPGERVVRVLVYIDGRRILRRRGHRLKYLTVTQRPIGNFTIRIVAITNLGSRVVSTRLYRGCAKLAPHTVVHRHHRHP